jgi:hypothetical protein
MRGKRIIAISLLVFASSLPIFFSGFFLASRLLIRITMLERVDEENVTTLFIPEKEFKWYNPGHEIIVGDKMFDVKSIHLSNGIYTIKGLFDENETELNKIEEDYTNNKESKSTRSPHQIFQSCLGIIAIPNVISEIPHPVRNTELFFFTTYSCPTLEGFPKLIELPPNYLLV